MMPGDKATLKTLKRWANSPDNEQREMNDAAYGEGMSFAEYERRVGRPRVAKDKQKQPITMRLNPETIERWRATGKGWQTRLSEAIDKLAVR